MEQKVVLITGASRGMGRATALELASRGHKVHASMRDPHPFEEKNISSHLLDVTKVETIEQCVSEIIDEEGRLDVVINNAGYALFSPVELATAQEILQQFDVNLFGVLRVIRAVLPQMRNQKSGHLINISSVAGVTSNMGVGIYCGTKHALEAISESLAATVAPWGIKVSVIEPGSTKTEFFDAMQRGSKIQEENPYEPFISRFYEKFMEAGGKGQPVEEVAQVIADVIEEENPSFRYQTNDHCREVVSKFITDPSGNRWINKQVEKFGDWFE